MNAILPDKEALILCNEMITELDNSQLGKLLSEPSCGRMLGIMLCTDGTILKAFSGQMLGSYSFQGFVSPCFETDKMLGLMNEADLLIKEESSESGKSAISREYCRKISDIYRFTCFDGKVRYLSDMCENAPAGTGDCCAPRLLNACYSMGKKPLSMAEFFYGNGSYKHKSFHTPCDERCKPILKHIIGLDIVYLDSDIIVVNKPSGLLAIEGKTESDCVASRVRKLISSCIKQPCIHRLDQATSGLMVLGLTDFAHNKLSLDFENRNVYKEYTALIEGKIFEDGGKIELPIRLDTENRPHQIVDFENGKMAVTNWEKIKISKYHGSYATRLLLKPETGRTHQLRVHCAYGLKHPICNDALYGSKGDSPLCLCASKLSFKHPVTGQIMSFEVVPEF